MSKLSLREIAQSQLDSTPVIDGQLIVCLDTGNAYRDTATAHVKIGSDLEVVSDLPLAPLAEKLYYLKPDKLYVFLGGNWTLLNDKTIDLDEVIAKLPAGSSTSLNDDVEIITQDTDITQSHYYRRKLVVLWEYIKTKAQDFFAAKNHKHGKADITDFPTSMPASDVYPWAKAATKPSYTKAEVGLGKVDNTADADKTVKRATTAGTADSANSVAWENVKDKPTTFPVEAHTHDDRYYTEAEVDGKLNEKLHEASYQGDLNDLTTTGLYHLYGTNTNVPANGNATVYVDFNVGTPYQVWTYDMDGTTYRRTRSSGSWTSWTQLSFTDTKDWTSITGKPSTFPPEAHNHDDRYYTEAEMDGKLGSKVDNTEAGVNGLINKLESGTAVPVDNDLIVTQWANHTTATAADQNRYVRRPMSSIWSYIKSKADGVYQPKGSYATTDTKNTAGSTNTTSKLYLIGATSQSTNPQTYSNAGVYTTGSTIYANGFGNDIFIIYPSGGSASYGGQQIGYCKITLPTLWNSTMMTFTVTIYNYVSNTSVDYRISGYNYSGKPWYNCAAVCVGKAGTSHSNLSVRFGDNGTKNVITIGEENTEWEYPRIVVHDVVIGNSNFEIYKSGWNVEISKSGAPNVSETISNTHVGYNAITSWDKIQNKPSSFTPASHAHDDRYYTETEMNAKLDGKANSNHSHYSITTVADNRNTNTTPNDYRNTLIFQGLKDNSKINSPSSDTYSYLLGLRGWYDSSGGNSHELAFNNTGVYWRNGSSEWGGWNRIYADNYHPNADYATNAGSANALSGLSSRSSQGWGVQTGTFIHGECDSTGGDFAFRRDCPNAGQLSMVLDGRFYQNEGQYRVLDTSDEPNLNVNSANFAKETYINRYKTVNLTDLDQNTWYPVTGTGIPYNGLRRFKCNVQLNSGSKPSWSAHSAGFTAVVDILEESSGWGTTNMQGMVLVNDQYWINDSNKPPVGYQQMSNGSIPVWWLRGGGSYRLATDYDCTWTIRKSTYTNSGQSVSPTTTYPGVGVNRSTITANLNGKATTAEVATVGVRDYNNANRTIRIGYDGAGLTKDNLTHIAGYTENGNKIKDVSKDVLRSWLGLGASAYKKVQSLSAVGHTDWKNQSTDDGYVPTMAFMAFWNGAFNGSGSSNLQYCDRGRFGTIVTKNSGDYAIAGHTHNSVNDIGSGKPTTFAYSKSGMNYGDYTWLAGWNGYELRAVNKSQFAVAGHTHSFINSVGVKNAQTGRNQIYGDVYSYNSNASANTGMPTTYTSTIGFGQGSGGTVEICGEWTGGKGLWSRALRDYQDNWYDWQRIYTENYHPNADHATSADSATTSNGVKDYNDANRTIKIGFAGAGLNASNLTHIAGYTDNGTKIKDVNKDVLKSWIGLGNYLPLSGGTVTGRIVRSSGGSWISDRDRTTVYGGYPGDSAYGAVAGMATKHGTWTIGNLGGDESLIFNYAPDANYTANKNETAVVRLSAQAGTIITSATIGNQTVNTATYANYLNFTYGNEINFNGTPDNNKVYVGYRNTSVNEYKFNNGNGSGGLAQVTASQFNGSLNGTATNAEYLANDSAYMRMHWSGQSGQPSWLWGGNDASNMYVYNPSNFSVNYAATAGNGVHSSSIAIVSGYIRFNCGVQICWDISTSTSDRGSFTFPQNFVYDPCIVISGTGAYRYAFYITKNSSTSFSYYRDGTGSTVSPQYVAFGRWK